MNLIIPTATFGEIETNYLTKYRCLASENEYIPISVLNEGSLLLSNTRGDKEFVYSLLQSFDFTTVRRFSDFCGIVTTNTTFNYIIQHINLINTYCASSGRIFWLNKETFDVVPLLLICVKSKYLYEINRETIDKSKFCIVIDRKFINDIEHFKLYRNVKKHFIDGIGDMDIVYTNDIIKLCFNSNIQLPKFRTIVELVDHTNQINNIVRNAINES